MPRPSDVDFDKRFLRAYQDICAKVDTIAKEPTGAVAMGIFGALNVMAAGFADNLVIDDHPFSASAGPKHIFRGFAALVAGRYRQDSESEEDRRGLAEVAKMDARYGEDGARPTAREIDACIDHRTELNYKRPPNPVGKHVFGEGWKAFIKARDAVIEKTVGKKGGVLDYKNPQRMLDQMENLEKEIEGQGWDLQGPEICRVVWDILPIHMRKVLKETKIYRALLAKDFKDDDLQIPASRYSGLATALWENFGGRGSHSLGSSMTQDYKQGPMETNLAFAERIRFHMAKDLGSNWSEWHPTQRTNLARRFVEGMTDEDYRTQTVPKSETTIRNLSWSEFTALLMKADEDIGPRGERTRRVLQTLRQTSDAPAAAPAQPPAVMGYPNQQAYAQIPAGQAPVQAFRPAQPHQASANFGQATASMPSAAQSLPTPMSVSQAESVARIKDSRCVTCLDHVPAGTYHADPCPKDPVCRDCLISGHVARNCTNKSSQADAAGQPQRSGGWNGRGRGGGRGRGRGGFQPRHDQAQVAQAAPAQPQPPSAEPVNQVSMLSQRFTHQTQAVRSVRQQPTPHQAAGPRKSHQNKQQRKNGTKSFESQYRAKRREWLELERLGGEIKELSNVVKIVVGDIVRLTKSVGDQFDLRPIVGNPPLGQVSQVGQGGQSQGVTDTGYETPVHHHTLYQMNGDRVQSYEGNMSAFEQPYVMYSNDYAYNKDTPMLVNVERENESWGIAHDIPQAQDNVEQDAWNDYSDPYNVECGDYGQTYDYDAGAGYESRNDPSMYVYDNPSIYRQSEPPASGPVTYVNNDPYIHRLREGASAGSPASFPLSLDHSGEPDNRPAETYSTLEDDRAETPISFPISRYRAEKTGCSNDQEDDIHTDLVVDSRSGRSERDDDILPH